MKTIKNYGTVLLLSMLMFGVATNALAQGRGNGRDNNPGKGHRKENSGRDHDKHVNKQRDNDRPMRNDRDGRDRPVAREDQGNKDRKDRPVVRDDRDNRDRSDRPVVRDDRDNNTRDRHVGRDDHDRRREYSRERYRYRHHVTYNHYRYRRPMWAPVYGYYYNTRYIFYNDYNVYYDCYRDVFVTWVGRRWVVTHVVPSVLLHVDFNRAMVSGVDYWDDDFNFYLAKRRPSFVSIRVNF